MDKELNKKLKSIYDFLLEKNKKIVEEGGEVSPFCYAIALDERNEISVLPIPLTGLNNAEERRFLLKEMGSLLSKEKVKVKMFIIITEAWASKVDAKDIKNFNMRPSKDPNKIEVLMVSARDCWNNMNNTVFEIKRGKDVVLEIIPNSVVKWRKVDKKVKDTLLDSIWKEYRN